MPKDCVKLKMSKGMKRPEAIKACYAVGKAKKLLQYERERGRAGSGYGDVVKDNSGKAKLKNYRPPMKKKKQ